jgi:molecular chaperone DnaJ
MVSPHPNFEIDGINLVTHQTIDAWGAMVGTSFVIKTVDDKEIKVSVPAGTQPNTVMAVRGHGHSRPDTKQRGDLLVVVSVEIPKNLTKDQITHISNWKK